MTTQEKREKLREVLNSAEIAEIRHALMSRRYELLRLKEEAKGLGLEGVELQAHLYVINGEEAAPGLLDLLRQDEWKDPAQVTADFKEGGEAIGTLHPTGHGGPPTVSTEPSGAHIAGGPEAFVPTLEQIEEARENLNEHGWPTDWDELDFSDPLVQTMDFVRRLGWTRAIEMAKKTEGWPEEEAVVAVPGSGDLVKIPAKGPGRNPVFRIHSVRDGVVALENARGKELRPVLSVDGLKWDPEQAAWLLTYDMDASEFLTVKEFNALREERELPSEEDLPKIREPAAPPELPEQAGTEEAGARPAGLEVGDPLVVMDGEKLSICLVGPISVMPPFWVRILDPEEAGDDPGLDGKEVGRVQAGALEWDGELEAWTVEKARGIWAEEKVAAEST